MTGNVYDCSDQLVTNDEQNKECGIDVAMAVKLNVKADIYSVSILTYRKKNNDFLFIYFFSPKK